MVCRISKLYKTLLVRILKRLLFLLAFKTNNARGQSQTNANNR